LNGEVVVVEGPVVWKRMSKGALTGSVKLFRPAQQANETVRN
jgi:hypothetical protein